jgi:hypothetical protein
VFAAARTLRSREVSHNITSSVSIEESEARIEQQIDYDVRYESIQELRFEIPDELRSETNQPEIALLQNGGESAEASPREVPLRLTPPPDDSQSTAQNSARLFSAALPQARLGKFSVVLRFNLDKPGERSPDSAWRLPLVQSLDGKMGTHRVACRFEPRFTVSLDPTVDASKWQQISSSDESTPNSAVGFVASRPEASLPLNVQTLNANSPTETFVDRVWLQTWVSGDERQERAAFRFRTAGTQATVELAPQTPDALEVLLDGERADILSREPGRVVVAVHQPTVVADTSIGNETTFSHTLELRYRIPIRTALLTRHVMTPHQMVGSNALTESYWQIILPTDTHLIRSPRQMTAANVWQWLGSFWGRRPTRSQQELEEWSGVAGRSGPAESQNEYLFTGLAPVSTMQFVTAPRWLIVLVASATVLGLALVCIHVPAMRRPQMLGALACLLAGLGLAFPAAALLLAQASMLGLVLAVMTVFIARLVARPAPWGVIVPASGTHREAIPRLESIVMPPVAVTASTSPTVPLRVPEPE